ncbi:MAG TPA: thioredoxin-dependent thiol peroxidase [Bellilinea sp.]
MILENSPAPAFTLQDENDTLRSLSDYLGRPVVLYFYPEDDTPGCTAEACNFRDDYSVYQDAGVVILGVSPDSPKSHAKFKAKYKLPFTLLADEGHAVCDLYGVWGPKKLWGHEFDGVIRTTFLIDEQGMVKKIFPKITVEGHSAKVLAALKS